eukprot:CAMPEP_0170742964 /NCGR_PEP_ID=MMETSP0437-20130122/7019_1 /TAXON_ID=0 /ORGANISM="Sexangularia sp." /LENGTH=503 /DNA_ID=CAMNT_0011081609 /DNA_START=198 /DNA_END=1710 /DNA_ORIENTATION=+
MYGGSNGTSRTSHSSYGAVPAGRSDNQQYGAAPPPSSPQYGQAPPPSSAPTLSHYGQAPPPGHSISPTPQYGQAPPPSSTQYGQAPAQVAPPSHYGQAPPVAVPSGMPSPQYGQAPPPSSSQYGQAPPTAGVHTSTTDAYGQVPPSASTISPAYGQAPSAIAPAYGQAPPPSTTSTPSHATANRDFIGADYWKPQFSRQNAESILSRAPELTAILRPSRKEGSFAVSYKKNGDVLHTQVDLGDGGTRYIVIDARGDEQRFVDMAGVFSYLKVVGFQNNQLDGGATYSGNNDHNSSSMGNDAPPPHPGSLSPTATEAEYRDYMQRKVVYDRWIDRERERAEARARNLAIIDGPQAFGGGSPLAAAGGGGGSGGGGGGRSKGSGFVGGSGPPRLLAGAGGGGSGAGGAGGSSGGQQGPGFFSKLGGRVLAHHTSDKAVVWTSYQSVEAGCGEHVCKVWLCDVFALSTFACPCFLHPRRALLVQVNVRLDLCESLHRKPARSDEVQ